MNNLVCDNIVSQEMVQKLAQVEKNSTSIC